MHRCLCLLALAACLAGCCNLLALEKPGITYKIFQFPPDRIPTVDGDPSDWVMVPDSYVIDSSQLTDTSGKHNGPPDPKDLDIKVRVGWVAGLNRLYFLYEAYDNVWDFAGEGLKNDTFEIVVDADASGGPLIDRFHPNKELDRWQRYWGFHGVHAQNYHIFTPAEGKDWAMAWGCQPWIKRLPWSNVAYRYDFKPGESGKLILEFWVTPFDYASCEGPDRSVESRLQENKVIGLSWAVLDYDDVNSRTQSGFWNLSPKHTMYGNASELVAFRLMPLEPQYRKKLEAYWDFQVIDMDRRVVAFRDLSAGNITSWRWDFGDGATSTEQHPVHVYQQGGQFVVVLWVEGPDGKARHSKVWDVTLK